MIRVLHDLRGSGGSLYPSNSAFRHHLSIALVAFPNRFDNRVDAYWIGVPQTGFCACSFCAALYGCTAPTGPTALRKLREGFFDLCNRAHG
jgi:hypothetical protein